jgi:regulatory protein
MVNANRLWHNQGVMPPVSRQRAGYRPLPPLDVAKLDELALSYVGRFATSRGKLVDYLRRKLRERGWDGDREPDLAAVAERLAGIGYIDDAAFALSKARVLGGRGYGAARVRQTLHAAHIDEPDREGALDHADDNRVEAALKLAKRRRIGPFAPENLDPVARQKAIGAMLRAGHPLALARAIIDLPMGHSIDHSWLRELR